MFISYKRKPIASAITLLLYSSISTGYAQQENPKIQVDTQKVEEVKKKKTEATKKQVKKETEIPSETQNAGNSFSVGLTIGGAIVLGAAAAGGGGSNSKSPAMDMPPSPEPTQPPVSAPAPIPDPGPTPAPTPSPPGPSPIPVIPSFEYSNASHLRGASIPEVHNEGFKGKGVSVGVIDTGVNPHSEFGDRLKVGKDFSADRGISGNTDNAGGHGTHVAGIIGAGINSFGMIGVAPEADIHSFKVFDKEGSGFSNSIAAAINHSRDSQIKIINLSLGLDGTTPVPLDLALAMSDFARAGGIGAISAGNDAADTISVLAQQAAKTKSENGKDAFIAVGSGRYLQNGNFVVLSSFSNKAGEEFKNNYIVAPGDRINSTQGTSGYGLKSGTSMAAPMVTGTMALIKGKWQQLRGDQIVEIILNTADDVGDPGVDAVFGRGLLNAQKAMAPVGQTFTEVNGRKEPLSGVLSSFQGSVPAYTTVSGKIAYVDSYERDFYADAKNLARVKQKEESTALQNLEEKKVYVSKLGTNLSLAVAQGTSDRALNSGISFPFSKYSFNDTQLKSLVSYQTGQFSVGADFSERGFGSSVSYGLGNDLSFKVGVNSEKCASSTQFECNELDSYLASSYKMENSVLNFMVEVSESNISRGNALFDKQATSASVEYLKTLTNQNRIGLRVEARPKVEGEIRGLATGYNQVTKEFEYSSLKVESQAPISAEFSLLTKLDAGQGALKHSLEYHSNPNGEGKAEAKLISRYSLNF